MVDLVFVSMLRICLETNFDPDSLPVGCKCADQGLKRTRDAIFVQMYR